MIVRGWLVRGIAGVLTFLLLSSVTASSAVSDDTPPDDPVIPAPVPVVVSARPAILGTTRVGYQVSTDESGWSSGTQFSYQWLRDGNAIGGATSEAYWLVKADQGKRISVAVTGALPGAESVTATSFAVGVSGSGTGKTLTAPFVVKGVWVIAKDHRVAKGYLTKGPGVLGSKKVASEALKRMLKAARQAGYSVQPSSGYRSYATQTAIWKRNVKILGKKKGEQLAAPPGASEHNAGLAFDLRSGTRSQYAFGSSAAGKWVAKNAWRFGFILRYPKGKTSVTGYAYEPWHFRYVGTEHSRAFAADKKLTLEEYLGLA